MKRVIHQSDVFVRQVLCCCFFSLELWTYFGWPLAARVVPSWRGSRPSLLWYWVWLPPDRWQPRGVVLVHPELCLSISCLCLAASLSLWGRALRLCAGSKAACVALEWACDGLCCRPVCTTSTALPTPVLSPLQAREAYSVTVHGPAVCETPQTNPGLCSGELEGERGNTWCARVSVWHREQVQHPEVEAGQPSLRLGLGWSQGACCRAGGSVCVERWLCWPWWSTQGKEWAEGRACTAAVRWAGKAPLVGLESMAARGLLPKSSPRAVPFGSRPRALASSCSTGGMAWAGPIWPAYRGLAGIWNFNCQHIEIRRFHI